MRAETLEELEQILRSMPQEQPFPVEGLRVPRGKTAGTQKVALPPGFLDNLDSDAPPGADAEIGISGG